MFALAEIVEMNDRAVRNSVRVEDNHNRHCSFSGDASRGVVLHSALLRNTCFLPPARAKNFLRRWNSVNSAEARDAVVESFFAGV